MRLSGLRGRPDRVHRILSLTLPPVCLLAGSAVVWQATRATFSDTTSTAANSWATATVKIINDEVGIAVFNGLTNLKPDAAANSLVLNAAGAYSGASSSASGGSACIKVTYTGSITANIRMYGTITNAGLAQYLLFSVDTGTNATADAGNATNVTCSTYNSVANVSGPSPNSTVYLSGFPNAWATANTTAWTNAAPNASKWYRISWLLPANTALTGASSVNAQAVFTWEAQNI
ncbi:hypothetical protein QLQ12_46555 [Actinoplanes sp. NEAU-A12]|uniref:Uncharacterized protein n=1 Tax=Actinoplanes sandaracinus TaxID=3045177 RepID=A0ABT6X204_9ACTN|nr:hypothetical protein [Actinoplanes sandaracinus]MDI6106048.1 hypothetical protein [Actinoplanes sandaracinus]